MTPAESRTLERVQRLLALARGRGNDNERASAESLARELMARHGITEEDVARGRISEVPVPGENLPLWQLAVLQGCASVRGLALIRRRAGLTAAYTLVGSRAHTDEALYIFRLLVAAVDDAVARSLLGLGAESAVEDSGLDRLARDAGWPVIAGKYLTPGGFIPVPGAVDRRQLEALRDSFRRGMARALQERLQGADFRRRDERVPEHLRRQHPQAEAAAPEGSGGSPTAFADGFRAGMAVDVPDPRDLDRDQRRLAR